MRVPTRYGIAFGFALVPWVCTVVYHYQPAAELVAASPWLVPLAPVVQFAALEAVGRLGHRVRLFGWLLALIGVAASGVWWWWMNGLLAWGHAERSVQLSVPTVVVAVHAVIALVGGRWLSRRTGRPVRVAPVRDGEPADRELVSQHQ